MTTQDYLKHDWIKQKYDGILEIYPTLCTNTMVLDKVLLDLQNDGYEVVKICNAWIRAFERSSK